MWANSSGLETLKASLSTHAGGFNDVKKKADVRVYDKGVEKNIDEVVTDVAEEKESTGEEVTESSVVTDALATVETHGKANVGKLVLDANAFIHGVKLDNFGADCEYYTIDEVIEELIDDDAKARFNNFPYPITVCPVNDKALRFVNQAATQTGDYCVLSLPDRKIIALTYQLEVETHGMKNIKTKIQSPVDQIDINTQPGSSVGASTDSTSDDEQAEEEEDVVDGDIEEEYEIGSLVNFTAKPFNPSVFFGVSSETEYNTTLQLENTDTNFLISDDTVLQPVADHNVDALLSTNTTKLGGIPGFDDGQWITPDNVEDIMSQTMTTKQASSALTNVKPTTGSTLLPKPVVSKANSTLLQSGSTVACITTDYAMQNVLLQCGLRVLASNGLLVTKLQQYIMGCHGCYTLSRDMGRAFCAKCGGHTMVRVSVNIDKKGKVHYKWPINRINNTRGTVYAIPNMKGGKRNKDLILREDMMPKPKLRDIKAAKAEANMDLFEQGAEFAFNYVTPSTEAVFGYGRRNPNVVRKHKK